MERGSRHAWSWMIVPAAGTLVASALSLPSQPYTGLVLREDQVVEVVAGSPGERAGCRPGDRLLRDPKAARGSDPLRGPLASARPLVPLDLVQERGGRRTPVRLVAEPLPPSERRMMAAMLAVASGFVLLGGWVWSERRDRLTLPFYLLCLSFASMLAPPPRFSWAAFNALHDLFYTAVTLALPALCIHFFALFPEPRAPRGRMSAGVTAAYGVAALLFAGSVVLLPPWVRERASAAPASALLQGAAAVWFAAGLLSAVVLFGRSYARAGSPDARRRLRVALAGTALGLGPLAALIVLRNLSPTTAVPGERWAVVLTLWVPLSFAWATVVHRVFDFRVALRVAGFGLAMALLGATTYLAGELARPAAAAHHIDPTGAALALVALGATLAGPSRPWAGRLGRVLAAQWDAPRLAETLIRGTSGREIPAGSLLARACESLASALMLDQCQAVELPAPRVGDDLPRRLAGGRPGVNGIAPTIELSPRFADALMGRFQPLTLDDPAFAPADREALENAGINWVLPASGDVPVAALLLGRRLTGPWLDRRELEELERFGRHLGVTLENAALRRDARSRGALDRELEQAGAIQAHFLPRRAPAFPTLDCAAAALSSEPVGGDYYDFVERSSREFTVAVGDAAGKGVPAALLLAGVQARFRSEALRGRDPGQLLGVLNEELVQLDQPEKFVCLLCARVDVRRGRITFSNAGLTPPLVRRRGGGFHESTGGGLLLGVRADSEYRDTCVDLSAGDVALLYSDGLTEARRGEEMFGLERVRAVLDACAGRRARDILAALLGAVREFADRPLDDLTVVVLRQLTQPAGDMVPKSLDGLKSRPVSADTSKRGDRMPSSPPALPTHGRPIQAVDRA